MPQHVPSPLRAAFPAPRSTSRRFPHSRAVSFFSLAVILAIPRRAAPNSWSTAWPKGSPSSATR